MGPRLYGNWRPERGWGVGSLSTTATVTVFLAVLAPVLAVSLAPVAALPLAGVGALLVAGLVVRIGGVTTAEVLTRRVRYGRARAAGWTQLSAGVLTDHPRGHDLPGLLAPIVPSMWTTAAAAGMRCCGTAARERLSAVLRCSPIGVDLADPGQVDAWIAGWAALLADLGYQPLVTHIAVTVDTSPTGGATVRDHVAAALDPHAPALARRVLQELAAVTPAAAAEVDARLTVTLDPRRAQPKPPDLLAAVVDVGRWLPGIETALAGCGVAVLGRASTGWLTGRIRAAFDPATRPDLTRPHRHLAQRPPSRTCRAAGVGRGRAGRRGRTLGLLPA